MKHQSFVYTQLDDHAVLFHTIQFGNSVWFGLASRHIKQCRLFNAKSSSYVYIRFIGFGLVGFYGIKTIVGNLMPNSLYTYILNKYDL